MNNDDLYERALSAINKMNADPSASLTEALDNLRGLRDEIEMLMDGIQTDIRKQGKDEEKTP